MSNLEEYRVLCQLLASADGSFKFPWKPLLVWMFELICFSVAGEKVVFPEVTRICLDFARGLGVGRRAESFWNSLFPTVYKRSWPAKSLLIFQIFQPWEKQATHSGVTTGNLLAFWYLGAVKSQDIAKKGRFRMCPTSSAHYESLSQLMFNLKIFQWFLKGKSRNYWFPMHIFGKVRFWYGESEEIKVFECECKGGEVSLFYLNTSAPVLWGMELLVYIFIVP